MSEQTNEDRVIRETKNNDREFPHLDLAGFNLLVVEKALYDLYPIDFAPHTFKSYRLVDACDKFDKCYSGIVIPDKHPSHKLVSNDMLFKAEHDINRCGEQCLVHRISFLGFASFDDEMIPECKLYPFHTEVKGNEKGMSMLEKCMKEMDTVDNQTDVILFNWKIMNDVYEKIRIVAEMSKQSSDWPLVNPKISSNHPYWFDQYSGTVYQRDPFTFNEMPYYACIRRGAVLMCTEPSQLRAVKPLLWLRDVTAAKRKSGKLNRCGGQVSDSSCQAKRLQQACKYARIDGHKYKALRIVMPHHVLVIELFVRFGGLKQLVQEFDKLSKHITDNPHDFELWWAMVDVLKNMRYALAPEWAQSLTHEMERCVMQWIQTCVSFLPNFARIYVLQHHIMQKMMKCVFDDHLDKEDGLCDEFWGRHWALFTTRTVPYIIRRTFGYREMSSRWVNSSECHELYAREVRSLFESYVDLLPDLLNIVYSYCDVL